MRLVILKEAYQMNKFSYDGSKGQPGSLEVGGTHNAGLVSNTFPRKLMIMLTMEDPSIVA